MSQNPSRMSQNPSRMSQNQSRTDPPKGPASRRELCSVALAAEQIGERWTVLLLREVFWGSRRFETIRENLGIARNILTDRLRRLVELDLLEKRPVQEGGRRCEYRLTEKGRDLLPVLLALTQWGDRWLQPGGKAPVEFRDRSDGRPIARIAVRAADGRELAGRDLLVVPGPGATRATRRRIEAIGQRLEPRGADPRARRSAS